MSILSDQLAAEWYAIDQRAVMICNECARKMDIKSAFFPIGGAANNER